MTRLASLTLVLMFGWPHNTAAEPPNHTDFRPTTFSRPSRAQRRFFGSREYAASTFSAYAGQRGYFVRNSVGYLDSRSFRAFRPSYYNSVIGNYGPSPYTGLDASAGLYLFPAATNAYGSRSIPPFSFYENTYPYGSYSPRSSNW
jgi:hypothetical protein